MCDRPLRGFPVGHTKTGKINYFICSSDIDYIYTTDKIDDKKDLNNGYKWIRMHGEVPKNLNGYAIKKFQAIPCGSCLSCRITRAAEMADRCMLERKYHENACFVTLTYDDEHIISTNYSVPDTGELGYSETLFKKHYIDFFKRLRKRYPNSNIRYVLCGEYGETTQRPHYHAIIFGYWPNDAVFYSVNKRGQRLYVSEELNKIWKNGYCVLGDCDRDSCNYVSRYVTKKLYGDFGKEEYEMKGRIPPFIVSSKRPAIGKVWFDDNKDWCMESTISYSTPDGGHTFKAPRYFKKLYDKENLDYNELDRLRDLNNEIGYLQEVHFKDSSDMLRSEVADVKERISKSKAKAFTRDSL